MRRLESGGQTLEESLALWERGEQLADICQRWLARRDARLDAAIAEREAGDASRLIDRVERSTHVTSASAPRLAAVSAKMTVDSASTRCRLRRLEPRHDRRS